MGSLARFLRLPASEKACFAQAWVLLPLTAIALRFTRLQRWQSALDRGARNRTALPVAAEELARLAEPVARMVRAASRRLPFQPTCLHQSVVLQFLLARRGIPAQMRLGSQLDGAKFQAHAWVECGGHILNDADDIHLRYTPFDHPVVSDEARSR